MLALVVEPPGELWLCNAQHVKTVPGRKSDLSDAEWLADVAADDVRDGGAGSPPTPLASTFVAVGLLVGAALALLSFCIEAVTTLLRGRSVPTE